MIITYDSDVQHGGIPLEIQGRALGDCKEWKYVDTISASCLDFCNDDKWAGTVLCSFHLFELESEQGPTNSLPECRTLRGSCKGSQSKRGEHASKFDKEILARRRAMQDFVEYVPSRFLKGKLRGMREFKNSEVVKGVHDVLRLAQAELHVCEEVRLVSIEGVSLSPHQTTQLSATLRKLNRLEVLILRGTGMKSVDNLGCASLLYIDASQNQIHLCSSATSMLSRCTSLRVCDFGGNDFLVESDAESRMIAICPTLEHLNGCAVDVQRKVSALAKFGGEDGALIGREVWDHVISLSPPVSCMRAWDPSFVTRLSLRGANLTVFHVGLFVHTTSLDLTSNKLRKLCGSGLEQLGGLRELLVSRNRIADEKDLAPLEYLASLALLHMAPQRAPDTLTTSKTYRQTVISLTMESRGTDARPGLNWLDCIQGMACPFA